MNYLGHFALASQLAAQRLARAASGDAAPPLRVVAVSSVVHKVGHIDYTDLQVRLQVCLQVKRTMRSPENFQVLKRSFT